MIKKRPENLEVFEKMLIEAGYTIETVNLQEHKCEYNIVKDGVDLEFVVPFHGPEVEPEAAEHIYGAFLEFFEFVKANI